MSDAPTVSRSPLDVLAPGVGPELRDARLLAWLLDPQGEHELGRKVLVRVATCLTGYGRQELSRLLVSSSPPPVESEVRLRGGRVEVVVACGGRELVLAWRNEGRPEDVDLLALQGPTRDVVGVGLADGAFPPGLPVLVWSELAPAVEVEGARPAEPWGGLLAAFRQRLTPQPVHASATALPAAATAPPPAPSSSTTLPAPTRATPIAPSTAAAKPPPPSAATKPQPSSAAAKPPSSSTAAPAPTAGLGQGSLGAGAAPPPAPSSGTRRVVRPGADPRTLAQRLLREVPALGSYVPGLQAPSLRPQDVSEGTMLQSADRRRTYLIHRVIEEQHQSRTFEVLVQGQASFPGYEEEVGIAAIQVPHQGSDLLPRLEAALAVPDPSLVRLLAVERGSTPFLLLERLAPHPLGVHGVCDPVTAVHTYVNLLEALPRLHERLDRILCAISPRNLRLRCGGAPEGAEYLARLASGAWEPVLVGLEDSVPGGSAPPLVAGDPLFLPPESLPRGGGPGRYSRKTDVYALTLTFYQLLTGDLPYARTGLHERQGQDWLGELLSLKEKGTSPVNGLLIHGRFPPQLAETILDVFRGGLAADSTQRRSAEELLELCRARLGLVERRPAIPPEAYVWDDVPGLHLQQTKLPQEDLRQVYRADG